MKNDKAFCWKAFRLIAKKNVGLLSKVSAQGGSLEAAAKHLFESGEGAASKDEAEKQPTEAVLDGRVQLGRRMRQLLATAVVEQVERRPLARLRRRREPLRAQPLRLLRARW